MQEVCSRNDQARASERGAALIMALMFTTVVVGVVVTGTLTLKSQITTNRTLFITNYQAVMAARSGLTEALSWLRRQTSQPVTEFHPILDEGAVPPVLDTEDQAIGLVRDFQISGSLWARYEVWREWAADPDPDRLMWREQFHCQDISAPKAGRNAGAAWRLRSVGYVYRRHDESLPFNAKPNVVLATEMTETDVLRAVINLPGEAAVNVGDGNSCHINTNARINGAENAGIYFPAGTGRPTTGPRNQQRVTGYPALSRAASYDDSYQAVFGLTFAEISSMADMIVTDEADFPNPIPDNALIVVDVGSTFNVDSSRPLTGTGLVVVNGNMVMNTGNNSLFSGMLYVDGNFTMRAPSEINGSVIVTGNMTVQGSGDYATINFDADALSSLMSNFGAYRRVNSIYLPRRSR
ncbi:MAG: hypothetical protein VYD05_04665 [Planctomycetota bacterium]|nr:hypothetical protein [Planctomycetota bacterium]